MSKIISVSFENINRSDDGINGYIIIYVNKGIENVIPIMNYTTSELVELICDEYSPLYTKIIFIKGNHGSSLYEELIKVIDKDNVIALTPTINQLHELHVDSLKIKDFLYDIMLNSSLRSLNKTEIKKLKKEIDNIEYKVEGAGVVRINLIDQTISKIRAICLMQYMFYIKQEAKVYEGI